MMKLWLLAPIDGLSEPWRPDDVKFRFIICAATEEAARVLAAVESWDEGEKAWLDSALSTCVEFVPMDKEKIIMSEFYSNAQLF